MESFRLHRILKPARPARGFTLIEMLVVLAIVIIITAIALSGQSGFSRTVSLNNEAYNIALSIRQAQSYGLSTPCITNQVTHLTNCSNHPPFGIYLIKAADPLTAYSLYADTDPSAGASAKPDAPPGDGQFSSADTVLQQFSLNNGFSIRAFCVYGSGRICTGADGLVKLSILFTHPQINTIIAGQVTTWSINYTNACIQIQSNGNPDYRYVNVSHVGQITVGDKSVIDPGDTLCP